MMQEVMVTLDITMTPEAAEHLVTSGNDGLAASRGFTGFREVRVVRHEHDPCRFLFIQRWESEASYRSYIQWRTDRGEFQALNAAAIRVETNLWPQTIAFASGSS